MPNALPSRPPAHRVLPVLGVVLLALLAAALAANPGEAVAKRAKQ